eukprot:CAMPEP_0176500882 /NCGR_PEP_ID=MMETSP0200_2-20121128/13836_1 /TAXON_ID=947934 /ORGANISM="Chaetoceros sp., Strain GSL56" /LENGTH=618 /DNA_ID=CAMNT_0017899675 /DNA_START=266 /DNA_END=2119 /DNA_ORIENTATION=-
MIHESGVQTELLSTVDEESQEMLLGRVSAETVRAPDSGYPPYRASIMDGYALNSQILCSIIRPQRRQGTLEEEEEETHDDVQVQQFHVLDRIYAGSIAQDDLLSKSLDFDVIDYARSLPKTVYITTGAVVPSPYDAIIPVEDVDESHLDNHVVSISLSVLKEAVPNLWIRPIGCDIKPKAVILKKQERIEPVHLGLLIQCGVHQVRVTCLPKVAIVSTGTELYTHGEKNRLGYDDDNGTNGMIPDANGPVLCSLLATYNNCQPTYLGIRKDNDEQGLMTLLKESIKTYDVVITSGGISMGEMDVVEKILVGKLGCSVHFGRLNMKPGKPTTLLTKSLPGSRKCLIFAMPGNPVSAIVCTELLVRPCLDLICEGFGGGGVLQMVECARIHPEVKATLRNDVMLDASRPEYHRVTLEYKINERGDLSVNAHSTGVQRSSRLQSMCDSDGLMLLPQGVKGVKVKAQCGEMYPVLLTKRLLSTNILGLSGVQVKDSIHLGQCPPNIGLLQLYGKMTIGSSELDQIDHRLIQALIGGNDVVLLLESKTSPVDNLCSVFQEMKHHLLDVIFVVGVDLTFVENITVAKYIKEICCKRSESFSSLLLQASVVDAPLTALSEPVVGW